MSIILVLIAISLSIALTFLLIFIWCMRSGQYDDTFAPAVRILFDDAGPQKSPEEPLETSVGPGGNASEGDSNAAEPEDRSTVRQKFDPAITNFMFDNRCQK